MAQIFINVWHSEPHSRALIGIDFSVDYSERQAEVSILGMPSLSEEAQNDGIQAELVHLAEAILSAVRNPQGIIAHPRPQA
jgi:hypothetical protein